MRGANDPRPGIVQMVSEPCYRRLVILLHLPPWGSAAYLAVGRPRDHTLVISNLCLLDSPSRAMDSLFLWRPPPLPVLSDLFPLFQGKVCPAFFLGGGSLRGSLDVYVKVVLSLMFSAPRINPPRLGPGAQRSEEH